ncbi:hypothetical protein GQX73_g10750 [Xylaria multiplex]|uniref:MINDY deubiquitinase domain-containing protein n=1 Tax=Xylaria multiplex TaxID=323545 RepID=A0A7C8IJM5_9PEZI|nr:hypothetical protein GQX73_g10750 [Xylaria multiplex]
MVAQKPTPESLSTNGANDANNTAAEPPRIELSSATDSEVDSPRVWGAQEQTPTGHGPTNETRSADESHQVPAPLRPGAATTSPPHEQGEQNPWFGVDQEVTPPVGHEPQAVRPDEVPTVLRPGVARSETNPFKRKPVQRSSEALDTLQKPFNELTIAAEPPTETFSLRTAVESPDQSTNPWQPALDEKNASNHASTPLSRLDQDSDKTVWGPGSQLPSASPGTAFTQSSGNTPPAVSSPTPANPPTSNDLLGDEDVWEGVEFNNKDKGKLPAETQSEIPAETSDGWNLVDHEPTLEPVPGSLSKQSTWENFEAGEVDTAKEVATHETEVHETEAVPPLPPRTSVEVPLAQPPRRQSPSNVNMSETYQIKNINWHDPKAAKNPRKSPILVQNANGPCPLVALVNALTLTTPADETNSNLVETLRAREQISLSFLLEVVVDELMSSRHTNSDAPLPDMSELYGFLQGLHTGMNVNPRFMPSPEAVAAHTRTLPSDAQLSDCDSIPGTFENTRDMELYATFRIPLIHGWLPPKDDMAYDALKRRASSYDEAQTLLFHEEELEHKFSNSETGLTEEEQQLYQDIINIKSFLSMTATQLTSSGLDVVTKSIKPGEVSILFRNDHFSTLYRHPQTLQLFTLVTDAGYFTHDEVVWESLADVRGKRAEFFSGDFRVVGGNQSQRAESNNGSWHGPSEATGRSNDSRWQWQTVGAKRSNNNRQSSPTPAAALSQHEQEDRDLALALQLQEEEEERHRTEQAARRRESRLSEQFIEQQGRDNNRTGSGSRPRGGSVSSTNRGSTHSLPPPRSSSTNQPARAAAQARGGRPVQQVRSLIPPRLTHRPAPEDGLEDAPPSYEQAAKSTPYLPPAGHPSHPESNPRSPVSGRSPNTRAPSNAGPSTPTRSRQSTPSVTAGGSSGGAGKDRDCVLM